MRPAAAIVLISLIVLLLACTSARATQNDVTVYRCTDARGQVELRDSPCPANQRQQTRQMLRPKDAPPSAPTPATTAVVRENVREVRYVLRQPRPLYECTAADGSRYTSESGEGNPRWQPAWIATPPWGVRPPVVPLGGGAQVHYQDRHTSVRIGQRGGIGVYPGMAYAGGSWVRDSCSPMPEERMCAMLSQRRDDIQRRNVLRQPSEQAQLNAEESSINARLRDECGG
ncbi:DUF4124 domain-containing protein [Solilutibacter silvestris]|uniref:DUF4124 domain-containing protein n=1 Tax=Solilutibacter silvestris TaxID=1645665 RepID=UPI003D33CC02